MNSIEMLLEILFSIDLFSYPLGLYILYYIRRMHNKNNIYIYIHGMYRYIYFPSKVTLGFMVTFDFPPVARYPLHIRNMLPQLQREVCGPACGQFLATSANSTPNSNGDFTYHHKIQKDEIALQ